MSHSCDESYDVYIAKRVRARKTHKCCACREPIVPGHHYIRIGLVFDGSAESYKRCLRCQTIFEALVVELRGSDEWPDEDLNCGHEWSENLGKPVPDAIAALAFLSPAEVQALTPKVNL